MRLGIAGSNAEIAPPWSVRARPASLSFLAAGECHKRIDDELCVRPVECGTHELPWIVDTRHRRGRRGLPELAGSSRLEATRGDELEDATQLVFIEPRPVIRADVHNNSRRVREVHA